MLAVAGSSLDAAKAVAIVHARRATSARAGDPERVGLVALAVQIEHVVHKVHKSVGAADLPENLAASRRYLGDFTARLELVDGVAPRLARAAPPWCPTTRVVDNVGRLVAVAAVRGDRGPPSDGRRPGRT